MPAARSEGLTRPVEQGSACPPGWGPGRPPGCSPGPHVGDVSLEGPCTWFWAFAQSGCRLGTALLPVPVCPAGAPHPPHPPGLCRPHRGPCEAAQPPSGTRADALSHLCSRFEDPTREQEGSAEHAGTVSCQTAVRRGRSQPAPARLASAAPSRSLAQAGPGADMRAPCPCSPPPPRLLLPPGSRTWLSLEVPRQPWRGQLWAAEDEGFPWPPAFPTRWEGAAVRVRGREPPAALVHLQACSPWGSVSKAKALRTGVLSCMASPKAGQHRVPSSVSHCPLIAAVPEPGSSGCSPLARGTPSGPCPPRPQCSPARCPLAGGSPLRVPPARLPGRGAALRGGQGGRRAQLEGSSRVRHRTSWPAPGLLSLSAAPSPGGHRLCVAGAARCHTCVWQDCGRPPSLQWAANGAPVWTSGGPARGFSLRLLVLTEPGSEQRKQAPCPCAADRLAGGDRVHTDRCLALLAPCQARPRCLPLGGLWVQLETPPLSTTHPLPLLETEGQTVHSPGCRWHLGHATSCLWLLRIKSHLCKPPELPRFRE